MILRDHRENAAPAFSRGSIGLGDVPRFRAGVGWVTAKTRLVLMFPGFEPVAAEAHCRRFLREAQRTAPVYGMTLAASEVTARPASASAVGTGAVTVTASGKGWSAETEIVAYGLGELTGVYAARNPISRLIAGYLAWADFIVSGTLRRYLATAVRYGIFFVFPLLVLIAALIAAATGAALAKMLFPALPQPVLWLLGALCFALAVFLVDRRWHFLLVMDDWTFARDLARGRRADVDRRFSLLSADISRRLRDTDTGEVVFAAHSFGAIAAVRALADALQAGGATTRIGLLTVGSSLLKIALHPAASDLRAATARIVAADVPWLDVQSLTDILNFYGTRPAELIAGRAGRNQNTTRVRFRNQLEPATYRAIRRDFFRVHRQFVFGVERRSHYSYHAILCGPEPFAEVVRRGGLSDSWQHLAEGREQQR